MTNFANKLSWLALCAAIALTAVNVQAENVSPAAARQIAANFVKQAAPSRTAQSANQLRVAHIEASTASAEANAFYVFNVGDNDGFVIIAGDDRANQVLGYSDHGSLNWDLLPDNMKAWLGIYRKEIEYLQKNPDMEISAPVTLSKRANSVVGPLCPTTWGQEAPYYNQCPKYQGEFCVSGCVATAMAQVMNYWKYPNDVTPSFSAYSTSTLSVPAIGPTTFKWDKMLNSYCHWDYSTSTLVQDEYTDAQAAAVAELMRYCGQAVKMNYSPEGSGAYTWNQESAMEKFGFVINTGLTDAYNYTTSQWKSMLNDDLNAGRPILYSANDDNGDGGHAFLIDGYDSNGYYHLNWGWYGTGDGYYPINALNVEHRDGTMLYYNTYQDAILGVEPPADAVFTYAPVVQQAEDITGNSFTARWTDETAAENVNSYTLYVYDRDVKPAPRLLDEVDWSTSSDIPASWTKQSFYRISGGCYFSSDAGFVQSCDYDLERYDKLTVMVYAKGRNGTSKITVSTSRESQEKTSLNTKEYQWYTFTLDCAASDYMKLSATYMTMFKGIKVYAGDPENGRLLLSSETGDATERIITGITDTNYTVTGLTAGSTYVYYVEAFYSNNKSQRSNTMEVTLSGLAGDVNEDGLVDVIDLNLMIEYLLGNNPAGFNISLADLDHNSTINANDMNRLINIILGN